jgi:hypothetical protein
MSVATEFKLRKVLIMTPHKSLPRAAVTGCLSVGSPPQA